MPKSQQEQELLKEQFKQDILVALKSFDQKVCSVKDLAKAYRELKGQNVNVVIDELDEESKRPGKSGNFWHFLKFNCQSFCDVFQNDGEFRVLRTNDVEMVEDKNKKKGKKQAKAAPKLNLGRAGVVNDFSFPRLNPQGFAKTATPGVIDSKPAMSTAWLKTNYASVYRSAQQLKGFETQDDPSEGDAHCLAPTVYYNGSSTLFEYDQDEQSDDLDDQDEMFEDVQPKAAPVVSNPFDFPALSENIPSDTSANLYEGNVACWNNEKQPEIKTFVDIAKAKATEKTPAERPQENLPVGKPCSSPTLLDDPVFRFNYPDVVSDPHDGIPMPKLLTLEKRILFDVCLTNIHSPKQFWFQCSDRSFDMLYNRLNNFYSDVPSDGLVISKQNAKRGLVVAVKFQSAWYRARIIEESNASGEIDLLFVDYGIRSSSPISDIRYLLKSFAREPARALRGSLFEVSPKNGDDWTNNDRILFFNVVAGKKLFASIRCHHQDEDVYELELSKSVSSSSNDVAQFLVNLGCAEHDKSQSTSFAIPIAINKMSQLEI